MPAFSKTPIKVRGDGSAPRIVPESPWRKPSCVPFGRNADGSEPVPFMPPVPPEPAAPFKPSAPLLPLIPPSHGCPFITAARLSWRSCSRRCCSSSSCVGIVKNAQARVIKKISMSPVIVFLSKTAVIMWVDWVQAYRLLFAPSPAFSILRRAYLQWIGATI